MNNPSLFAKRFMRLLDENVTGSAFMGGTADNLVGNTDMIAPGDGRMMPHFSANTPKKKKKVKESKKKKNTSPKARVNKQGLMGSASREHRVGKGKGSFKRRDKHQKGLTDSRIPIIRRTKPSSM
jgi:hypothetical protein